MDRTLSSVAPLRRYAIARSLFAPTTLARALERLGFVQADPIRAPARAQDLILRPRVRGYRAGDLDRLYPTLDVEEDTFVNYGFLTRAQQALMHPRQGRAPSKRERALLDFVRGKGEVHPRDVDERLAPGKVRNAWGGSSSAVSSMLEALHYRGHLRVARREGGLRVYGTRAHDAPTLTPAARLDALVDLVVSKYAPLPGPSLSNLVTRLRWAAPHLGAGRKAALARAHRRLAHARLEGVDWYWPAEEKPEAARDALGDEVRLLAPFDPVVWDRRRFELFWGWAYRFEAYTPVSQRKLGYYALPLLWRDEVLGWANLGLEDGQLKTQVGFVAGRRPKGAVFRRELDAELERIRRFLP